MGVYNDEATVERAARSILDQTWRELELVVIDDGSTDGSSAILERLAESELRVRVIRQENAGLTRALIRGCNEARGRLIARQDSDDWSHPERIAEQVRLIDSDPSVGFVSCATEYVGPRGEHLTIVRRPTDAAAATRGLLEERQGPPAHGSVMFRRELYDAVGGYRPEFHFGQDSDLWLRMAERAQIAYSDRVLYAHRREGDSTSGARRPAQKRFGELGHLCRAARLRSESEQPWLDEARALAEECRLHRDRPGATGRAVADAEYMLGSQLVKNRNPDAARYLWRVVRARPLHVRAWVRLVQSLVLRAARQGSDLG